MRKQFIATDERGDAEVAAPWATKIVKVCGGYQCFESLVDYEVWKNQK